MRRIVLSGCSGGGKSTLLAALAARGFATVEEPGRRIIRTGGPDPSVDGAGFAARALDLAIEDHAGASQDPTFFDRSALDALIWHRRSGTPLPQRHAQAAERLRYANPVFLTPPWPDIYVRDEERRHDLTAAIEEFDALEQHLPDLGYRTARIPQLAVEARVAWVLARLDQVTP